ncbi:MAG: hypothetical protein WDA06_08855 [Phenylobacterium sp.]
MSLLTFSPSDVSEWLTWIEEIALPDYPIIAVGRSGALIGLPLAYSRDDSCFIFELDMNRFVHLKGHCMQRYFKDLNQDLDLGNYIIIDDCVSSGNTLQIIATSVKGKCQAVALYAPEESELRTGEQEKIIKEIMGERVKVYINLRGYYK